ncbi:hypothetical protein Q5692_15820 [Microcoleus sp. C2C3]|uniref:hypothetical protein n=1 Tax=unclassified Microcoleus TaxID=2642155 RepID=UPI002FD61FDF
MPSDKPRLTLRLDQEDIDCLENWAKEEFLTIPQLARVVVKRAIAEYLKRHSSNALTTNTSHRPQSPSPRQASTVSEALGEDCPEPDESS